MALVQIRDVYKSFQRDTQRIDVFTGLSLDVAQGSFTALMGPSGSGKSTLLNLIAGLDRPTSGTVQVAGAAVHAMTAGQLAAWRARHIGFVFQQLNLLPVLTAYQNVELPLLLANLGRHKRRTFLTAVSVALALFLFASLRTVVTTIAAGAQFGSARRLVVTNATGIVFPLPIAYAGRLRTLPGVQAVSWANWFGGRYGDGKRFFATFAVDPASYLAMYPEIQLPPDQREAFLRERSSAIVGKRLLDVFGWRQGQDVTVQGTIFGGDWTFTIRGVYTPSDRVINDDMLIFRHDYFDERLQRGGIVGWYILQIANPDDAAGIAKLVDDQFKNSR